MTSKRESCRAPSLNKRMPPTSPAFVSPTMAGGGDRLGRPPLPRCDATAGPAPLGSPEPWLLCGARRSFWRRSSVASQADRVATHDAARWRGEASAGGEAWPPLLAPPALAPEDFNDHSSFVPREV